MGRRRWLVNADLHSAQVLRGDREPWVLYRTVDYWLWAATNGLTGDPERYRRLAHASTQ